jgi:hypothetical protein
MGHSASSAHDPEPVHEASQEHASLHRTRCLQELSPEHVTVHADIPQWISSPQASLPEHTTSQLGAVPHSTCLAHASSPQTTLHGMFGAHFTSPWHAPSVPQLITHTPATHVPFVQPSSHSACAPSVETASVVAMLASGRLHAPATSGAAQNPSAPQIWPSPQSVACWHVTVQSRSDGE